MLKSRFSAPANNSRSLFSASALVLIFCVCKRSHCSKAYCVRDDSPVTEVFMTDVFFTPKHLLVSTKKQNRQHLVSANTKKLKAIGRNCTEFIMATIEDVRSAHRFSNSFVAECTNILSLPNRQRLGFAESRIFCFESILILQLP